MDYHTNMVGYVGRLRIISPIQLDMSFDDNGLCRVLEPEMRLDGIGTCMDEALNEFMGEVLFAWDAFAKDDNGKLDDSANELRSWLLAHLEEIGGENRWRTWRRGNGTSSTVSEGGS